MVETTHPVHGNRRARAGRALLLAFALASCSDATGPGPSTGEEAELRLGASVAGTSIDLLVATVNGPGILRELVFNIPVIDDFAAGTLRIPAGESRTILVRAFAPDGALTHEGQATIDVRPGPNPPVNIQLAPRPGQVPILVSLGMYSVHVDPPSVEIAIGDFIQLNAYIQNSNGDLVPGVVEWATTNPAIATVDEYGLVNGLLDGVVEIVATYEGVAGSATITVGAGNGGGGGGGSPIPGYSGSGSLLREGDFEVTDILWPAGFCEPTCTVWFDIFALDDVRVEFKLILPHYFIFDHFEGLFADGVLHLQDAFPFFDGFNQMDCVMDLKVDFSDGVSAVGYWEHECTMASPYAGAQGRTRLTFELTRNPS